MQIHANFLEYSSSFSRMSTKVKGLLKGLKYISHIFEEEKQQEMQIGFPTDVKHVAHIGWDGPSTDAPSWMKEYRSPNAHQSAPLGLPEDLKENPEIKWVSDDSRRGSKAKPSSNQDSPEMVKSSRRRSSNENGDESPKKKTTSTKSRSSRRHQTKEPSDGSGSVRRRQSKESSDGSVRSTRQSNSEGGNSPSASLPDIPRKSRRKKSKDTVNGGSTRSRNRATPPPDHSTYIPPFSDPGPVSSKSSVHDLRDVSSLKPIVQAGIKEISL